VGGKVFLYSPSGISEENKEQQVQFLNLNKSIKALTSARLGGDNEGE